MTSWWFHIDYSGYPHRLGKWSNLTNVIQMGWNHQLDEFSLAPFELPILLEFPKR